MAASQRLAVVIGNSEYQHFTQLKNAKNDAEAVRDQLQGLGYETSLKLNSTKEKIFEHLESVMDAWKHDASEIVLFYAGHGVAIGKLHR